jgi:hypothetical protein
MERKETPQTHTFHLKLSYSYANTQKPKFFNCLPYLTSERLGRSMRRHASWCCYHKPVWASLQQALPSVAEHLVSLLACSLKWRRGIFCTVVWIVWSALLVQRATLRSLKNSEECVSGRPICAVLMLNNLSLNCSTASACTSLQGPVFHIQNATVLKFDCHTSSQYHNMRSFLLRPHYFAFLSYWFLKSKLLCKYTCGFLRYRYIFLDISCHCVLCSLQCCNQIMAAILYLVKGLHKYLIRQSEDAIKKLTFNIPNVYIHLNMFMSFPLSCPLAFMLYEYGYLFRQHCRRLNCFLYRKLYSNI